MEKLFEKSKSYPWVLVYNFYDLHRRQKAKHYNSDVRTYLLSLAIDILYSQLCNHLFFIYSLRASLIVFSVADTGGQFVGGSHQQTEKIPNNYYTEICVDYSYLPVLLTTPSLQYCIVPSAIHMQMANILIKCLMATKPILFQIAIISPLSLSV